MLRRSALKTLSLGTIAASIGGLKLSSAPASRPALPPGNSAIYHFRIGRSEAFTLECGALVARPAQPGFAPEASAEEFAAALRDATPAGTLRMPFNVLLLDWNGEYVLIDTGEPGRPGKPSPLRTRLSELGIAPEQIAHVIITHAHFDHVGGLLDEADKPVFARARHHVFKAESDFWNAREPDVSKMRFNAADMIRVARRALGKIDFHFAEPHREILPGITALPSPGHTPGLMTLRLTSGESTVYHIADLCHHSRLLLEHPSWTIGSDVDPAAAARTRESVFHQLAESRERVFGFHLPFPGLGSVVRTNTGYRWLQEDWMPGDV
jgi:glyoxylase-like metal-dependent hydrolase (beta-lactamase superfamily II)